MAGSVTDEAGARGCRRGIGDRRRGDRPRVLRISRVRPSGTRGAASALARHAEHL